MISKLHLSLTAGFVWLLASSVVLSGAHASIAASLATINLQTQHLKSSKKSDDGGVAKLVSEPHNHMDKHSLKNLHKAALSNSWLIENRQRKQQIKQYNQPIKLFGARLVSILGF